MTHQGDMASSWNALGFEGLQVEDGGVVSCAGCTGLRVVVQRKGAWWQWGAIDKVLQDE